MQEHAWGFEQPAHAHPNGGQNGTPSRRSRRSGASFEGAPAAAGFGFGGNVVARRAVLGRRAQHSAPSSRFGPVEEVVGPGFHDPRGGSSFGRRAACPPAPHSADPSAMSPSVGGSGFGGGFWPKEVEGRRGHGRPHAQRGIDYKP